MTLLQRLNRARREYMQHPTRAGLRAYLMLKAKRGQYDSRMLRYYGIPEVHSANIREAIVRGYAIGLVPTATTNGAHSATSYHRLGLALDLGLPVSLIGTKKGLRRLEKHQRQELWRFRHGRFPRMVELIGPTNSRVVLRGRETDLVEGTPLEEQHDNHVHEAFTR